MADANLSKYSLRVKLKRSNPESVDAGQSKRKKSTKDSYDEWRERLKQNESLYDQYKIKDALKKKDYRKSLTGEKLALSNEKAKLRMREYRARQLEKGITVAKPSTRTQIARTREYWRLKKKEQREKMSDEDKIKEKQKRREKYQSSKKKLYFDKPSEIPLQETSKKAASSRKIYLPKNPEKFATKVDNAMKNATPRKKKALQKLNPRLDFLYSKSSIETNAKIVARVKRALNEMKRQNTKAGRDRYRLLTRTLVGKYTVEHSLRKALGMKWEHWIKMSQLERNGEYNVKRSDAMSDDTLDSIQRFYEYESVTLPMKRTVSTKTLSQKRVLTESLQQIHKRFLQDNPTLKISLSHFQKLRPKEVLTVKQQKFYSCLCEYCLNVQFKLDVINQAFKTHHIKANIESKYHAVDLSLCEKDENAEFHNLKCLERNCDECGTKKLRTFLECLMDSDKKNTTYTWKRWKLGTVGASVGKEVKRQILTEQTGTPEELVQEFEDAIGFLARHLFIARWQYKQFNQITKSVPEKLMVTIADFAENYRCVHQDEIQSAYYNYRQSTVFPMIAYYKCPDCRDAVVQESVVFISPDLIHDAMAVKQFSKKMAEHVKDHAPINNEIQFSDGCAAQFKSKIPFLHVSETTTHKMQRAYFGSRHGKSPCDALGGIIKKQAETYVKSRKGTIQTAKALFDYCTENLTKVQGGKCDHNRRVFFYEETIKRDKPLHDLQTLKGTQKIHSVKGVEPGTVQARRLSCFCNVCIGEKKGNCCNEKYVGDWEVHDIVKGKKSEIAQESKKQKKESKKQKECLNQKESKKQSKKQPKDNMKQKEDIKQQKKSLSQCSTMNELKRSVAEMQFNTLPPVTPKSLFSTGKAVDKNSMSLMPKDIPLSPEMELFPAVIYGDGNCLPRSASVLIYGSEDNHKEMRERIISELVVNEDLYLDNRLMKRGKSEVGGDNVVKTMALYSSQYNGQGQLYKKDIRKVYEKEVLEICRNGTYMGLWQLASLANILSCPIVSVCPTYGLHTVRNDMHRVFYPFKEHCSKGDPLFIMWTNINGRSAQEKDFSVNHFVVLMPLMENIVDVNSDLDMSMSFDSFGESEEVLDDNIMDIISNFEMSNTVIEDSVQKSELENYEPKKEICTEANLESTDCNQETKMSNPENTECTTETTEATSKHYEQLETTNPDTAEPNPEITEPNPEITEANPETTELKLEATEVNTMNYETVLTNLDVTKSNLETTEAIPETTKPNPEPTESHTETSEAHTGTTEAHTETTDARTDTTESNPEIIEPKWEATDESPIHYEPISSNLNVTKSNLETSEAIPETTKPNPEPTEAHTETSEAHTGTTEAHTETTDARTDTTESNPEIIEPKWEATEESPIHYEPISTNLDVTKSNLETTEAIPKTTKPNPEPTEAHTETSEAHTGTTEAHTETTDARTDTTESNPEIIEPKWEATDESPIHYEPISTNLDVTKSNLETTEAITETTKPNPEPTEAHTETSEAHTGTTEAHTETTDARTDTTESNPEIIEPKWEATDESPIHYEPISTHTYTTGSNIGTIERNPETTEAITETTNPKLKASEENTINYEPVSTNPETTDTSPEPTEAIPETTEAIPETTEPNPDTIDVQSDTTESNHETTQPNPKITEPNPVTIDVNPEKSESKPETTDSNPEITEPNQETTAENRVNNEPLLTNTTKSTQPDPETSEAIPETTEANPDTIEANPMTTEAIPETTESKLKATEENTTKYEPVLTYPETPEPNLETTETIPEVIPHTTVPNPETTEPNPDTTEPNTETTELKLDATEDTMQYEPVLMDEWPWIRYFSKSRKKNTWTLNEVRHRIDSTDIHSKINAPDIIRCGTRQWYKFKDAAPVVTSLSPTTGGISGEVLLYIYGSDLPTDLANDPTNPSQEEILSVTLSNQKGESVPCRIHIDGCTKDKVTCYTGRMNHLEKYEVNVRVNNTLLPACEQDKCIFTPNYWLTPTIEKVADQSNLVGELAKVYGAIMTTCYNSSQACPRTAHNWDAIISRVYAPGPCDLLDDADTPYKIELDPADSHGTRGDLWFKPKSTYVGFFNASIIVTPYGRSKTDENLLRVHKTSPDSDIVIYTFQRYTDITALSPATGSTEGGTNITISVPHIEDVGTSYKKPVEVYVGCKPCTDPYVVTNQHVTCKTPAQSEASTDCGGNRGFFVEYWATLADLDTAKTASNPDGQEHFDETKICDQPINGNWTRLTGYFKAPFTGTYCPGILATTEGKLFVEETEYGHSTNSWSCAQNMEMVAGQEYEIMAVAKPGDCLQLRMQYYDTTLTHQMTGQALQERQIARASSTISLENLTLSFDGSAAKQTPTHEQQTIDWGTGNPERQLCLFGVCTKKVDLSNTASVATELNKHVYLDTALETYIVTGGSGNIVVKLESPRGNIPDFQVLPDDGITVTETVKGKSDNEAFALEMNGIPSPLLKYNSDPNVMVTRLKGGLDSMLGVQCPSLFTSNPVESYDDVATAGATTEIPPFCGNYAIKNKNELSLPGTATVAISTTPFMCFAISGLDNDNVELRFEHPKGIRQRTVTFTPLVDGIWKYTCVDLKTTFVGIWGDSEITQVKLVRVRFFQRNTPADDFYTDSLMFINTNPLKSVTNITSMRMGPALPNVDYKFTIKTTSVIHDSETSKFNITLQPNDCGYDFSLPTVSGSQVTGSLSSQSTEATSNLRDSTDLKMIITRVSSASQGLNGTFKLSFKGSKSGAINITGKDDEIKQAIETIQDIGVMNVFHSSSSTCANKDVYIEFTTQAGDLPDLVLSDVELKTQSHTIVMMNNIHGQLIMDPIPGDMISTKIQTKPQVKVFVNGIPTKCSLADCGFTYSSADTPSLSGIDTPKGHVGQVVKITGNLFSTTLSDNEVTVAGSQWEVTAATATELTCQVKNGPLGSYPVKVNVASKGIASGAVSFEYDADLTECDKTSSTLAAGINITCTGYGFVPTSKLMFGDVECTRIVSRSESSIQCLVPEYTDLTSTTDVPVVVSMKTGDVTMTTTVGFTYQKIDAAINTITLPDNGLTVLGGEEILVTGSNMGTTGSAFLDEVELVVVSRTDTNIVLKTPPLPKGDDQKLKVFYGDDGAITFTGSGGARKRRSTSTNTMNVVLRADKLYPDKGSLLGGTPVTIIGKGFGSVDDKVKVTFGDIGCDITSVANDKIICDIDQPGKVHKIDNTGITGPYGYYFEFSKTTLVIKEGDCIEFSWSYPDFLQEQTYAVDEIVSTSDKTLKADGISSGDRTREGTFDWCFFKEGSHVLWTGIIDSDDRESVMTVEVVARDGWKEVLNVSVDGQETDYDINSNVADPVDNTGCVETADLAGCTLEDIDDLDTQKFNFQFTKCRTAILTSVEFTEANIARSATAKTQLIYKGSGFSTTPCANMPKVDECSCVVSESSSTEVTCTPDASCSLDVGKFLPLSGKVNQWGNVKPQMESLPQRSVAIVPLNSEINPKTGSKNGGTPVTITGSGYTDISQVSVDFGMYAAPCSLDTGDLVCVSPAGTSSVVVSLKVNGYASICETDGECSFTYDTNQTPALTAVTPVDISTVGTELTLTASNFGNDVSKLSIDVAGEPCTGITINSDTELTCTVQNVPAGESKINLLHSDWGIATSAANVNGVGSATLVPTVGSIHGGTNVSVSGFGFTDDVTIKVGEVNICKSMYVASRTQLYCETIAQAAGGSTWKISANDHAYPDKTFTYADDKTPKIASVSPSTGTAGTSITLTVSDFGTDTTNSDVTVWIGEAESTNVVYSSGSATVTLTAGSETGGSHAIKAHVKGLGYSNVDVTFEYTVAISSLNPSTGDAMGKQVVALIGSGFTADMSVTICGKSCTFDELVSGNEYRCLTPAGAEGNCDVVATQGQSTATYQSYSYAAGHAPKVNTMSPTRGGTGGNTLVTFTGTDFSGSATVAIDGVDCVVVAEELTADTIKCHTGSHVGSKMSEVVINTNGQRAVWTINSDFYYVDVWSSIASWGGESLPLEGEMIVIPEGQTMLLDTDTPVLSMLLIDGGHLIFDEKDVTLNAQRVLIASNGSLEIGSEERPFPCGNKAQIFMHGDHLDKTQPVYGTKGIGVRNGTINMFGCRIVNPGVLLASTAEAGTDTITVQKDISDWKVGDSIAIATTGDRHSQKESEEHTIKAISGNTITLEKALEYKHLGESDTTLSFFGEPLEMRAETILLSRNILVKGVEDTDWNVLIEACPDGFDTGEFVTQTCFQGRAGEEVGSDQFGAHILFHNPIRDSKAAIGHFSFIEMTHVGQAFRLGRYPIHFHLNGDMSGSYVKGCAIHKSFNRAVNIHGSHNILVEHTVIYDIMGGAFFLEDGAEIGNTFQYNWAIFVRQSTSLRNDDVTPAAFWITHPNNIIQHNMVAGGTHFGSWCRMHEHPDGPSYTTSIRPNNEPLLVFNNNTVHSNGWYGLWIFETYFPCQNGNCGGNNKPVPATFTNLTVWNCQKGMEYVTVGAVQMKYLHAVNNSVGAEVKLAKNFAKFNPEEGALINDSVIAGWPSKSSLNSAQTEKREGLRLPFSEGFASHNIHFLNLPKASDSTAISYAIMDGTCVIGCGGTTSLSSNLTFTNVDYRLKYDWTYHGIIHDLDGSLSDTNTETKIMPKSTTPNTGKTALCPDILVGQHSGIQPVGCTGSNVYHRLAFNEAPSSHEGTTVQFITEDETGSAIFYFKSFTHKNGWRGWIEDKKTTRLQFENVESSVNFTMSFQVATLKQGEKVIIEFAIESEPDMVSLDGSTWIDEPSDFFDSSTSGVEHGDWYYHEGHVGVAIVAPADADPELDNDFDGVLKIVKCFYKDCIAPIPLGQEACRTERPASVLNWNDKSTWQTINGVVTATGAGDASSVIPQSMDNVTIPRGVNVLIKDVNPAMLYNLTIFGYLEVDNTTNVNYRIEVHFLIILGGQFSAGWQNYPLMGQLRLLLKGSDVSPLYTNTNFSGQMPGNKAIGIVSSRDFANYGCMGLYGRSVGSSWTTLAATVQPGDTSFTVDSAADLSGWKTDDEIFVTTTSFKPEESEKFTIKSVAGKTITVNSAFQYRHSVGTDQWTLDSVDSSTTFAASVGLLTRHIVIEGEDVSGQFHGGRVITGVGAYMNGTESNILTGSSEIRWVEFRSMGQYGYATDEDPRFALAYVGLDTPDAAKEKYSSVRYCSFWDPYNTAIGVFATNDITVEGNVVFGSAGSSIKIGDSNNVKLKSNLGSNLQTTATYNGRFETFNHAFEAIYDVKNVQSLTMSGNRAYGSERIGFHVPGEACDSASLYSDNYVSSCLFGLMVLPGDVLTTSGISDCVRFANMTFYMNADVGLYYNNKPSVLTEGNIYAENVLGTYLMSYEPSALSHEIGDKKAIVKHSTFIGTSSASDCASESKPTGKYYEHSGDHRTGLQDLGKFLVMFFQSTSGSNKCPEKPCVNIMSYNQISGKMIFSDNAVVNLNGANAGCKSRYLFVTSPKNEDLQHYILVSKVKKSSFNSKWSIFFHRPNVKSVNPSDCVDMTCDALTKAMVRDTDGSLLGSPGSIIPQAEWEWDGKPAYGKGDYRIPKEMLVEPETGAKLEVENVVEYRGLYREGCSALQEVETTSYYICDNQNFTLLVIESMDNDTETRRLSPVAVVNAPHPTNSENAYLDLINGPQDHGWCNGYTCQFRISTFHALIAPGVHHVKIFLSSTPPDRMKFYMLEAADDDCIIIQFFHPKPNRIDLYSPAYVTPKNVDDSDGGYKILRETGVDYIPTCADAHGANFVNRDTMIMYAVLKGSGTVMYVKNEVIIASFKTISSDAASSGDKIVENLALVLGIPLNMIRIVKIVPVASSSRRRREAETEYDVIVEIGDPPTETVPEPEPEETEAVPETEETEDEDDPSTDVSQYAADLMEICQLGSISEQLDMDTECGEVISNDIVYIPTPPSYIEFVQTLTTQHENVPFMVQPKIRAYDQLDNVVEDLGTAEFPWEITASLLCTGCHANAQLVGTTTIPAVNGWFNFTDLGISHKGDGYVIKFTITSPSAAVSMNFSVESEAVSVAGLPMTASIHSMTVPSIIQGNTFSITLDLRDETTNEQIPDLRWRDHTAFNVNCDLVVPSRTGNLSGTLDVTFDMDTGLATMDAILYSGYGLFYIACHTESTPVEYSFESTHKVFVMGTHQQNIVTEATENIAVRSKLSFDETLPTETAKAQFHQAFLEYFIATFPYILFTESEISRGSIVITFSVEGSSGNVTSALKDMCEDLSEGLAVTIGSSEVKLDSYMTVDGEDFYATCGEKDDDDEGLHPAYIALIVILALLLIAAIVFVVFWRCKIVPKKRTHDVTTNQTSNTAAPGNNGGFYYIDNGRTVFLAGPNQKVQDIFYKQKTTTGINQTSESIAPVGTLYDDTPGYLDVRKSPLPPDVEMGPRASSSLTPTGR